MTTAERNGLVGQILYPDIRSSPAFDPRSVTACIGKAKDEKWRVLSVQCVSSGLIVECDPMSGREIQSLQRSLQKGSPAAVVAVPRVTFKNKPTRS